jgi:nucleotide-binding universal stress UspA family protein
LGVARVLIGVDGSALARLAAQRALALLGAAHAITIVHVVRPTTAITMMPSTPIAGALPIDDAAIAASNESLVRDAEADVAATAHQLAVDAATRVVIGDPGTELCRIADEDGTEVIVVGSHGSGVLKRVLLGSVSHYVLHHARCPVLVVRDANDHHEAEDIPEEERTERH